MFCIAVAISNSFLPLLLPGGSMNKEQKSRREGKEDKTKAQEEERLKQRSRS
jgi:hypothetical protein